MKLSHMSISLAGLAAVCLYLGDRHHEQLEKAKELKVLSAITSAIKLSQGQLSSSDFDPDAIDGAIKNFEAIHFDANGLPYCRVATDYTKDTVYSDTNCSDLIKARAAFKRLPKDDEGNASYNMTAIATINGKLVCNYAAVDRPVLCQDALVTEAQFKQRLAAIRSFIHSSKLTSYAPPDSYGTTKNEVSAYYVERNVGIDKTFKLSTGEEIIVSGPVDARSHDKHPSRLLSAVRKCTEINLAELRSDSNALHIAAPAHFKQCIKEISPSLAIDEDEVVTAHTERVAANKTFSEDVIFSNQDGHVYSHTTRTITIQNSPTIPGLKKVIADHPVILPRPFPVKSDPKGHLIAALS